MVIPSAYECWWEQPYLNLGSREQWSLDQGPLVEILWIDLTLAIGEKTRIHQEQDAGHIRNLKSRRYDTSPIDLAHQPFSSNGEIR